MCERTNECTVSVCFSLAGLAHACGRTPGPVGQAGRALWGGAAVPVTLPLPRQSLPGSEQVSGTGREDRFSRGHWN